MEQELIPHLFRTEFARITSVLCGQFGMANVELAEDITSETFLAALNTWPYKGVPQNPQAWLYTVAKNKARNALSRQKLYDDKINPVLLKETAEQQEIDIDLSEPNIIDSQLQMLFAVCHPSIPAEGQIGLALRVLCGFGIDEIASAFLSNKETINKRLFRAKEKLRTNEIKMDFPPEKELNSRLQPLLTTLYLLFNEGYYSETGDEIIRQDLCFEAMRLVKMLLDFKPTNKPEVNALFALMCFHTSRFKARKTTNGELILYEDQDESLWDLELIAQGAFYLHSASQGNTISKYHVEAGIAYWHTLKADTEEKWSNILHLYNHLLVIDYSPIAALNRTFALAKVRGNEVAISEAEKLQLSNNPYYHTLLGELYKSINTDKAKKHFSQALDLVKSSAEKNAIMKKMKEL